MKTTKNAFVAQLVSFIAGIGKHYAGQTLLLDGQLAARLGASGRARALANAWPRVVARVEALLLEQLDA